MEETTTQIMQMAAALIRRNKTLINRTLQHGVSRVAMLSVTLLCIIAQGAWAEDVNYIYYKAVDVGNQASLNKFNGTVSNPTVLTSKLLEDSPEDNLGTGWYVLSSSFSYPERIVISGDVHLILKDGCTLTAEQGIRINTDATLSIYAQSKDEATMGKLIAIETHHDKAAIGGNKDYRAGELVIHGGNIEANCKSGSKYAAGIGGGYGDGSGMKAITIYAGKVTAQGAKYGAGIGGGRNNNNPGPINIYGGEIKATGGDDGAGIGGGRNRAGWYTNIYGGNITAQGGNDSAGIGGGGRSNNNHGAIHIYNGTINATGGVDGAGIGAGAQPAFNHGIAGTIIIDGGTITAKGNGAGAGIGGGKLSSGGTITINGGTVTAIAGRGDAGSTEHSSWVYNPSMIGYGGGNSYKEGSVTIENGVTLHLSTLFDALRWKKNSIGIGSATLNLGSNLKVTAKTYENKVYNASPAQRVEICKMESRSLEIMPCTEHEISYTVTAESHTAQCKHCAYTMNEAHSMVLGTCKCGYSNGATIISLAFPQTLKAELTGYATSNYDVVEGQTIALPDCKKVPEGWKFVGWSKKDNLGGISDFSSIEAADSETGLLQPGDDYTVSGDASFFARYRHVFTETWQWWTGVDNNQVIVTINNGSDQQINATVTSETVEATATTPAYTVYTATATYKPDNTTYIFTDQRTVVDHTTVELGEDDNITTLADNDGAAADVTLTGRTLYKDGKWNTLCLPFDIAIEGSPLAGATVKELTDASFADGTLTLTFADANSIEAGQAYLVKWDSGTDLGPSDLVFNGVTLSKTLRDDEILTDDEGTTTVTFMGTYKKQSYAADDRTVLFLGADNTLYYPQSGATIGAQRAYFQLSGITAGDLLSNARAVVLDFGDGKTTTAIIETVANSSLFILHSSFKEGWHTLDGRRLSAKPTQKGIYINNGHKIVME